MELNEEKDEEKAKMKWETKKILLKKKRSKKWGEGIMLMKFFLPFLLLPIQPGLVVVFS